MDREVGASIMLVGVLSIVALAVVLWFFHYVRFLWTIARDRADRTEASEWIDDPDDFSMNDKDIL
jgi:hypothetical protein